MSEFGYAELAATAVALTGSACEGIARTAVEDPAVRVISGACCGYQDGPSVTLRRGDRTAHVEYWPDNPAMLAVIQRGELVGVVDGTDYAGAARLALRAVRP